MAKMDFKLYYETKVSEDGVIELHITSECQDRKDKFIREVFDTKEEILKTSLKALGWVDPNDKLKIQQDAYKDVLDFCEGLGYHSADCMIDAIREEYDIEQDI